MASMTGVDLVLAITEPTVSGFHDLKRVIDLAKHFKVEIKVIINKYDLNIEMSKKIAKDLEKLNIEIIGMIPFSEEILASVKAGSPLFKIFKKQTVKRY